MTFRQAAFTLGGVGTIIENPVASNLKAGEGTHAAQLASALNPQEILRQVLDLTREGIPTLDVDERMQYAIAHPNSEVVDSLGAVSVVCMLYGAYSPENLIPAHLLTHRNFTTLDGLRRVITELNKKQVLV